MRELEEQEKAAAKKEEEEEEQEDDDMPPQPERFVCVCVCVCLRHLSTPSQSFTHIQDSQRSDRAAFSFMFNVSICLYVV